MADYGFTHEGRVYTPNGTSGIDAAENNGRNAAIEASELAHWQTRPERMLAYYRFPAENSRPDKVYRHEFRPLLTGASVTTWQGKPLGVIVSAHVYPHSFGSLRVVSLRVKGTNGATYYGRASYDLGSYVNLRKVKG